MVTTGLLGVPWSTTSLSWCTMGYMGYRSRGGAFEVRVIKVQQTLSVCYAGSYVLQHTCLSTSYNERTVTGQ